MLNVVDVGVGGMLFCVMLLIVLYAEVFGAIVVTGNRGIGMVDG